VGTAISVAIWNFEVETMSEDFDLCVCGSGPSAFFLVKQFLRTNPHSQVLVIEAGLGQIDYSTSLSSRPSVAQSFKVTPSINIGEGGTSQLWHNVLAPLDDEDFHEKSWIPNSGWPINKTDLDPFYSQICDYFGFSFDVFDNPEKFLDFDKEFGRILVDPDIFDHKIFVHPKRYLRTDVGFKDLADIYKGLNFKNGIVALSLEGKGTIRNLNVFNRRTNEKSVIRAKKTVLCCGALNNPEILLNSDGIQNSLPVVGKFLMDHPMGNIYQYRYSEKKKAKIYSAIGLNKTTNVKVALKLKKELREERKLANSVFFLRPSFSEGANNKSEELKNKLLTVRAKLKRYVFPFSETVALLGDLNIVRQIIQYKTGFLSSHKLTDIMFVTEQRPSESSSVKLTESINEYGNRRTSVKWEIDDEDLREVTGIIDLLDHKLMGVNDALPTLDATQLNWKDRLSSAAHHLGTVRMSADSTTGCVNHDLRIHGIDNVYVCDGSVFPTSGNANPTMTCMALAARLGDHLSND
jgi:choline dehydrogenase-like flavoprotein